MLDNADIPETARSVELARLLIDRSSVLATVAVMPDGRLVGANPVFLDLLGVSGQSALIGRDFREVLVHTDDWRHWERALTAGQAGIENIPLRTIDDREVIVSGDVFSLPVATAAASPLFAALVNVSPDTRAGRPSRRSAPRPAPDTPSGANEDRSQPDPRSQVPEESGPLSMPLRRLPVGSENVLLVADDAGRATTIGDSLMMLGYSIFMSADPAETMRQASSEEFPLVIFDASASTRVDPGRFAESLKRSGGRSALLIIGSPELEYLAHHEHVKFLKKPASLMDLATGVRAILDRNGLG